MWRSIGSVVAGFFAVALLSLVTDQLLHVLGVYPGWNEGMWETSDNLLALAYRSVYTVAGGWLTARLAATRAMRHVGALAVLGFLAALTGAVTTAPLHLGPTWYPIALVVTSVPLVVLGGWMRVRGGAGPA